MSTNEVNPQDKDKTTANSTRKRKDGVESACYPRKILKHGGCKGRFENKRSWLKDNTEQENGWQKDFKKHTNRQRNNNFTSFKKKGEVFQSLKEEEVGITEFINNNRFFGILKMRYTDFHVSEIDMNGRISKLTTQVIPSAMNAVEDIDVLKQDVPDSVWCQLQILEESGTLPIEIDVDSCSKQQRQKIHECVRVLLKKYKVVSKTVEKDGKKFILLEECKGGVTKQRQRDIVNWKQCGGEWVHFVLHKLNVHTMTAIFQLAAALKIKPNKFYFAGTKDRRACTTQWFTLRKVHPSNILRAARNIKGVFVGNFDFVKEPLYLGQLKGNHFRIALRDVNESQDTIDKAMTSLKRNGFINYFGLQRFGSSACVPSYAIGIALLRGQWEKAIDLILTPKEGEEVDDLTKAKKIYKESKNAQEAYDTIKDKSTVEAQLLKGVCICGQTNLFGALDWTPKNMRTMYMHSYQSLVWNSMVSRRIKEFGNKPIVGDLVYKDAKDDNFNADIESNNEWLDITYDDTEEPEDGNDCNNVKLNEEPDSCGKEMNKVDSPRTPPIKILTKDDLCNYTLSDIVMPTPGNSVIYPCYAKEWYEKFMEKDDLTTDLQQKNQKYSLPGNYRKILQIPKDLSWRIMKHKEITSDLLESDIDQMRRSKHLKDDPDGQYTSLIIEMSLNASTYATMALREILSCSMSKQAQTVHSENYCARVQPKNVIYLDEPIDCQKVQFTDHDHTTIAGNTDAENTDT